MSMEETGSLRRLLDVAEIKNNKARYGILVDSLVANPKDEVALNRLVNLFCSDARFDFGGRIGTFEGDAEIRKFYGVTLPGDREWVWHSFHSPCIDVDGDVASGSWTISALAVSKGADDKPPQAIYGRYVDSYLRTKNGWRQSSLRFVDESR